MKKFLLLVFLSGLQLLLYGQDNRSNVFLITLDGFRWQELFGGAVDSIMQNEDLTRDKSVIARFGAKIPEEARIKLLPWFWSTMANEGLIYGNRWHENKVSCTNRYWFSYPGYNEILTGYSDPTIDSNDKIYNKNVTVLEWLNDQPKLKGKVAAFGSWDVFPYIINDKRSGIPVNAGFTKAGGQELSTKEIFLNELQDEIPSPWTSVRLDAFTHHYMMEYVKKHQPRLVYISYGETDDFAHDGRYDHYLNSAHQTDQWIASLWEYLQQDSFYRDNTNLIISTDHGRGHSPMTEWKSHGTIYKGSHEIWIAAIGPGVPALGEVKQENHQFQNQIASTVAGLLGYDFNTENPSAGKGIQDLTP